MDRHMGSAGCASIGAPTLKETPFLETTLRQLHETTERLTSLHARIEELGDRAFGGTPKQTGSSTAAPPAPGVAGEIAFVLGAHQRLLDGIFDNLIRLERLA